MEIIQTELRLKDIEWVEKHLDGLKRGGRALGSSSLADKAKKEEIVSHIGIVYARTTHSLRRLPSRRFSVRFGMMRRMSAKSSGTTKR